MTDWYRRKTWSKTDETEFFAKLGRARKDGRAQYLKIQAIELAETKDKKLLKVAEGLLHKMLSDFPEDSFNRSSALHTLARIQALNGNYEKAIDLCKEAIDFETICPKVQTQAYMDYSELVIKTGRTDLFDSVEQILTVRLPGMLFPIDKYKAYSILSVIANYKGKTEKAINFSKIAEQNASTETSGLRYHKYLGVVKERNNWLDRLVKGK